MAVVAVVLGGTVAVMPAGAAAADGILTFPSTPVEYGTSWQLEANDPSIPASRGWTSEAALRGGPMGYVPQGYMQSVNFPAPGAVALLVPDYRMPPLAPGTYDLDFSAHSEHGTYGTGVPHKLTIVPAKLAIETRALSDVSDPGSLVVSFRFTGAFADQFVLWGAETDPKTPSGTWVTDIVDEDGVTTSVSRTANSSVLAGSFLWSDATPDMQYTVTTRFELDSSTSKYFTTTESNTFTYTAPGAAREFESSDAPELAALQPAATPVFGVPLWSVIVAGVAIAGLLTCAVLLSVKLSRTARAADSARITSDD